MKRLLIVAYHFPPVQGSTGVTRSLCFAKYLANFGWEVAVLTVQPRAYEAHDDVNLSLIPASVRVERAWALDSRRHLSILGRYPQFLALPDRWQSWIIGGTLRGLRLVRQWRPDVVMSTYPIASAHCIGYLLHRLTGVPWIAEMRDPMAQDGYPKNRTVWRAFSFIERLIFKRASKVVVTTRGAARLYADRFGAQANKRICVIPNGYDPELFPKTIATERPPVSGRPIELLHSGILYAEERDPTELFAAIAELKASGAIDATVARLTFRGHGGDGAQQDAVAKLGINDIVTFLPTIPYLEALDEMRRADGFLLLQASNCNDQIPAKLYEYLYCGQPILCLTDPIGDTAATLVEMGISTIAPLEDRNAIKRTLMDFVGHVRAGTGFVASRSQVTRFARPTLAGNLAGLLAEVAN